MINPAQQYEQIQKIQSFIIIIKQSKRPSETQQLQLSSSKNILSSLEESQHKQSYRDKITQQTKRRQGQIANFALKKIQYRTRLHKNVQRCADIKQKYYKIIKSSPERLKHWSSGQKKRESPHKSQLRILGYYRNSLTTKMTKHIAPALIKSPVVLPQLIIKPFLITLTINHCFEKFYLFRTLKQRQSHCVYLAQHQKNKTVYTLKIVNKTNIKSKQLQRLIKQLKIQSFLNHANILKIVFITSDQYFLYIFYEVINMINLSEKLKESGPLQERQVRRIVKQICSTVQYLQKNHIVHQNISPQSIYYQQDLIKLGDFNKSDYVNQKRVERSRSETFLRQQSSKDCKIDIWNIGILTYELLYGRSPIQLQQNIGRHKFAKQTLYFCQQVDVSDTAKSFIMICLEKYPEKRQQISQILQHVFLKGGQRYRWTTA